MNPSQLRDIINMFTSLSLRFVDGILQLLKFATGKYHVTVTAKHSRQIGLKLKSHLPEFCALHVFDWLMELHRTGKILACFSKVGTQQHENTGA